MKTNFRSKRAGTSEVFTGTSMHFSFGECPARCDPQKSYNAPIQPVPSTTVVPQLCNPVVDAESRSSLQPAADRISSIARCLEVHPP